MCSPGEYSYFDRTFLNRSFCNEGQTKRTLMFLETGCGTCFFFFTELHPCPRFRLPVIFSKLLVNEKKKVNDSDQFEKVFVHPGYM